jgi:hypothetical protein
MTYLTLIERRQRAVPRVGRRLLAAVPLPLPLGNPSCTREALRLGAAPRKSEWFPNRRQCGGGAMAFFFKCSGSVGGEEVGRGTLEHGEIAAQTDAAQTDRVNR